MSAAREPRLAIAPPKGRPLPFPESGALIVGSDARTATLVLQGDGVRPQHAAIAKLKGGGFGVVSVEGAPLSVNGKECASARLADGDTLEIGAHVLRVVAERTAAAAARVPERLAGFRVLRRLGSGAMGQVYLAVQESLAREVALKVLRPELAADAAFVRRFEAEARAAAALGHPNVVTVYDVGQAPGSDGAPVHFLAMEYMARGSLEERLVREGPLPARDVLGSLRDAARGLEYAEVRGLVHRDLKPANLMVDASGVVKIADLGLATPAEASEEQRVFGTAHFASPEQVRGQKLDTRSDLYSLGASAYRLLCGQTPFQGTTQREILEQVLEKPPRPLAPLAPAAPVELVALIERLLSKEPGQRAPSAAVLAREIDALVLRHDHGALAPLSGGRGRKLVLAAVLLALAGGAAWFALRPRAPDEQAEPTLATGPGDAVGGGAEELDDFDVAASELSDEPALGAEDAVLRAVERDAEVALGRAEALEDPAERSRALTDVVARFAGTSAAQRATTLLAPGAATEAPPTATPEAALAAARAPIVARIDRAFALGREGDVPAPPGDVEAALAAITLPPALVGDAALDEALSRSAAAYVDDAERFAAGRLAAADQALASGQFGAFREALEGFLTWSPPFGSDAAGGGAGDVAAPGVAAPDVAPPSAPTPIATPASSGATTAATAWSRLAEIARLPSVALALPARRARATAAIAAQPELEAAHEAAMARADRARTGTAIGAGGALALDLRALDLEGAARRIETAATLAVSRSEQGALAELAARLRDGARAFDALRRAHAAGEWRRRNVPVPGRRTPMAEILRFDERGMVALAGGEELHVAWADFAGRSQEVAQLFGQRLTREWTREEAASIATVATVAALGEFLGQALGVLDPAAGLRLSAGEHDALVESLERAREWAVAGGVVEWFESERRAALLVARALRGIDQHDALLTAWALERALADTPDALTVRALSDGRPQGEALPWPPAGWLALGRPIAGGEGEPAPAALPPTDGPAADPAATPGGAPPAAAGGEGGPR